MPVAVLTCLLLILVLLAPDMSWKWIAWLVLTVGVCSYVRDLYVAVRMLYLPEDILVMNVGPVYLIYSASAQEKNAEN